ncbi:HEAT repeat domain-containing protein [Nocardia sp. NPDC055029]
MPSVNVGSLTPAIRELVMDEPSGRRRVRSLSDAELQLLIAVAHDEQGVDVPLSRHRALGVLAAVASAEVVLPVLEQVAGDRAAGRTDRVAALRGLGRVATPAAERLLLGHITDADPAVRREAFAALGTFAGTSALNALMALDETGDNASQRQLTLTRAMIAHREGADGPFLPDISGSRPGTRGDDDTREVSLELKSAEDTTEDAERFRGPTFGIDLTDRAYGLRCGRAEWSVFVNRDLGSSFSARERMLERPWIAALMARWALPALAMTTQYLVMTRPVGLSVRVDVVRTDGEIAYTGSAELVGEELAFSVTDVDRPQTVPTTLAGAIEPDGVRLDVAAVSTKRVGKRQTQPARPDRG